MRVPPHGVISSLGTMGKGEGGWGKNMSSSCRTTATRPNPPHPYLGWGGVGGGSGLENKARASYKRTHNTYTGPTTKVAPDDKSTKK